MVKLTAQDMSSIAMLLARLNSHETPLTLGDAVVYDDGEPLGTIVTEDGQYKFSQEVEGR
jgi:hypothetical protein